MLVARNVWLFEISSCPHPFPPPTAPLSPTSQRCVTPATNGTETEPLGIAPASALLDGTRPCQSAHNAAVRSPLAGPEADPRQTRIAQQTPSRQGTATLSSAPSAARVESRRGR